MLYLLRPASVTPWLNERAERPRLSIRLNTLLFGCQVVRPKNKLDEFLEYVYYCERIAQDEGYNTVKKYTSAVAEVFEALRTIAKR